MKKALFILIVVAMSSLMFVACGDDEESKGGEGETCRNWWPACDPACTLPEICIEGECQELDADTAAEAAENVDTEVVEQCDEGLTCNQETGICEADEADGDEAADGDE